MTCIVCGEPLADYSRRHRKTCSTACRMRLYRKRRAENRPKVASVSAALVAAALCGSNA